MAKRSQRRKGPESKKPDIPPEGKKIEVGQTGSVTFNYIENNQLVGRATERGRDGKTFTLFLFKSDLPNGVQLEHMLGRSIRIKVIEVLPDRQEARVALALEQPATESPKSPVQEKKSAEILSEDDLWAKKETNLEVGQQLKILFDGGKEKVIPKQDGSRFTIFINKDQKDPSATVPERVRVTDVAGNGGTYVEYVATRPAVVAQEKQSAPQERLSTPEYLAWKTHFLINAVLDEPLKALSILKEKGGSSMLDILLNIEDNDSFRSEADFFLERIQKLEVAVSTLLDIEQQIIQAMIAVRSAGQSETAITDLIQSKESQIRQARESIEKEMRILPCILPEGEKYSRPITGKIYSNDILPWSREALNTVTTYSDAEKDIMEYEGENVFRKHFFADALSVGDSGGKEYKNLVKQVQVILHISPEYIETMRVRNGKVIFETPAQSAHRYEFIQQYKEEMWKEDSDANQLAELREDLSRLTPTEMDIPDFLALLQKESKDYIEQRRREILDSFEQAQIADFIRYVRTKKETLAGTSHGVAWKDLGAEQTAVQDIFIRRLGEYLRIASEPGLSISINKTQRKDTNAISIDVNIQLRETVSYTITGRETEKEIGEMHSHIHTLNELHQEEVKVQQEEQERQTFLSEFERELQSSTQSIDVWKRYCGVEHVPATLQITDALRTRMQELFSQWIANHFSFPTEITVVIPEALTGSMMPMEIGCVRAGEEIYRITEADVQQMYDANTIARIQAELRAKQDEQDIRLSQERKERFIDFLKNLPFDRIPDLIRFINNDETAFSEKPDDLSRADIDTQFLENWLAFYAATFLEIPSVGRISIAAQSHQTNNPETYALRIEVGRRSINEALQFTGKEEAHEKVALQALVEEAVQIDAMLGLLFDLQFQKSLVRTGTMFRYMGPDQDQPFLSSGDVIVIDRFDESTGKLIVHHNAARIYDPIPDGKIPTHAFTDTFPDPRDPTTNHPGSFSLSVNNFTEWFQTTDGSTTEGKRLGYAFEWMVERMPEDFSGKDFADEIGLPDVNIPFIWSGKRLVSIEGNSVNPGDQITIVDRKDAKDEQYFIVNVVIDGTPTEMSIPYTQFIPPEYAIPFPEDEEDVLNFDANIKLAESPVGNDIEAFLAFFQRVTDQTLPKNSHGNIDAKSVKGSIFWDVRPKTFIGPTPIPIKTRKNSSPNKNARRSNVNPQLQIQEYQSNVQKKADPGKCFISNIQNGKVILNVTYNLYSKFDDTSEVIHQGEQIEEQELSFDEFIARVARREYRFNEFVSRTHAHEAPPLEKSKEQKALEQFDTDNSWPPAETSARPAFWGLDESELTYTEPKFGGQGNGAFIEAIDSFLSNKQWYSLLPDLFPDLVKYNKLRVQLEKNPSNSSAQEQLRLLEEAAYGEIPPHLSESEIAAFLQNRERAKWLFEKSQEPELLSFRPYSWLRNPDIPGLTKLLSWLNRQEIPGVSAAAAQINKTKIPLIQPVTAFMAALIHPIMGRKIGVSIARSIPNFLNGLPISPWAAGNIITETYRAHPAFIAGLKARRLNKYDLLVKNRTIFNHVLQDPFSKGLFMEDRRETSRQSYGRFPRYRIQVTPMGNLPQVKISLVTHPDASLYSYEIERQNNDLLKAKKAEAEQKGQTFDPKSFKPRVDNSMMLVSIDQFFAMVDNGQITLDQEGNTHIPAPKPFTPPLTIQNEKGDIVPLEESEPAESSPTPPEPPIPVNVVDDVEDDEEVPGSEDQRNAVMNAFNALSIDQNNPLRKDFEEGKLEILSPAVYGESDSAPVFFLKENSGGLITYVIPKLGSTFGALQQWYEIPAEKNEDDTVTALDAAALITGNNISKGSCI